MCTYLKGNIISHRSLLVSKNQLPYCFLKYTLTEIREPHFEQCIISLSHPKDFYDHVFKYLKLPFMYLMSCNNEIQNSVDNIYQNSQYMNLKRGIL